MNLDKKYSRVDGSECNILQLVESEPLWAANIIQHYEGVLNNIQTVQHQLLLKSGFELSPGIIYNILAELGISESISESERQVLKHIIECIVKAEKHELISFVMRNRPEKQGEDRD